ncbi:uncharacterized protein [Pithys albifrons albifrons]|uniref:uncharacterized protein n=1 Tax=Pithys albifrons albifrons TaxID=3385563 RepID=UPI003A5D0673
MAESCPAHSHLSPARRRASPAPSLPPSFPQPGEPAGTPAPPWAAAAPRSLPAPGSSRDSRRKINFHLSRDAPLRGGFPSLPFPALPPGPARRDERTPGTGPGNQPGSRRRARLGGVSLTLLPLPLLLLLLLRLLLLRRLPHHHGGSRRYGHQRRRRLHPAGGTPPTRPAPLRRLPPPFRSAGEEGAEKEEEEGERRAGVSVLPRRGRSSDHGEKADEAFYRPLEVASKSQALVLVGYFSHSDTCWRNNMAKHKQSGRFLESIDHNFLTQMVEEKTSNVTAWSFKDECQAPIRMSLYLPSAARSEVPY